MGCFDTFVGKIECPHCKEQARFDEQTKNYDRITTMIDGQVKELEDKISAFENEENDNE